MTMLRKQELAMEAARAKTAQGALDFITEALARDDWASEAETLRLAEEFSLEPDKVRAWWAQNRARKAASAEALKTIEPLSEDWPVPEAEPKPVAWGPDGAKAGASGAPLKEPETRQGDPRQRPSWVRLGRPKPAPKAAAEEERSRIVRLPAVEREEAF